MKVYVASSWRNVMQPEVVEKLRLEGYEVYDFRNPSDGDHGFHWKQIDPNWQLWTPGMFRHALSHEMAINGFRKDMEGVRWCDAVVLLMPCGRSAHLEFGLGVGSGKHGIILIPDKFEPELMYKMADDICLSITEVIESLERFRQS